MTITQALEAIGKAYVPGVRGYYSKKNIDPWQQAHDDFEKVLDLKEHSLTEIAAERLKRVCLELIEGYKKLSIKVDFEDPREMSIMTGQEGDQKAEQMMSRRLKRCVYCTSKDRLKIEPIPGDELAVQLVCSKCQSTRRSNNG